MIQMHEPERTEPAISNIHVFSLQNNILVVKDDVNHPMSIVSSTKSRYVTPRVSCSRGDVLTWPSIPTGHTPASPTAAKNFPPSKQLSQILSTHLGTYDSTSTVSRHPLVTRALVFPHRGGKCYYPQFYRPETDVTEEIWRSRELNPNLLNQTH